MGLAVKTWMPFVMTDQKTERFTGLLASENSDSDFCLVLVLAYLFRPRY